MKNTIRALVLLILVCTVTLFMGCKESYSANETDGGKDSVYVESPEEHLKRTKAEARVSETRKFVKQEILNVVSQNLSNSTWNEDTITKKGSVTMDVNGYFNGWVYDLSTNGADTGYIQVVFDGDNIVIEKYSFTEKLPFGSISDLPTNSLYYLGNSIFCHKKEPGKYYSLSSDDIYSLDEAKAIYDSYLATRKK